MSYQEGFSVIEDPFKSDLKQVGHFYSILECLVRRKGELVIFHF